MRPFTLVVAIIAIALGACSPSRTSPAGPAPVPAAQPSRAPAEPAATASGARNEPEVAALTSAPDRWWLLDVEADRVLGTGVARAYAELLAGRRPRQSVVVAIIDSGIDIEHEDLADNIWVNEDEVPGNGKDDDGNGFVDDVHGWNFIGGPDGRNVDDDTYEVTRLYAACRAHGAVGAGAAEPEHCDEIETAYSAKRRETEQMLQQVRMMNTAVDRFNALLREQLGVDSLTVERVRGITSPRADVKQAQQVYLQLAAEGITPAIIDEELERLEGVMKHGLDPSFDPRPIVGDDYANPFEHVYGNNDVEGPDPGHGTHVAGIIGAERGNGIGVDGIAPAVRIMVLRAVPDGDERDKDVANAIRYAADNGAQVINMSFGKGFSPHKDAVDAAVRYAEERGVLFIHAAGNDGADIDTEPNFPNRFFADGDSAVNWIEVGASSWKGPDELAAPFSNYGHDKVQVFAPGVDIVSTVPDNEYEPASGTSMAAPVVSGLAALIMAYYPELDAGDVKQILLETATRESNQRVARPGAGGDHVRFGELSATGGVVNAYAAIRRAEERAASKR